MTQKMFELWFLKIYFWKIIKLFLQGIIAIVALDTINNMSYLFYSPIGRMCFLSSAVILTLCLYMCTGLVSVKSVSIDINKPMQISPVWYIKQLFLHLWSLELPWSLSIVTSKMTMNLLMTLSLLAYAFGSMSAEAWLIMHMKHLVRGTFYIPPQYLCISLTISQSNSKAWYQEVSRKAPRYGICENIQHRHMMIHSICCFQTFYAIRFRILSFLI